MSEAKIDILCYYLVKGFVGQINLTNMHYKTYQIHQKCDTVPNKENAYIMST